MNDSSKTVWIHKPDGVLYSVAISAPWLPVDGYPEEVPEEWRSNPDPEKLKVQWLALRKFLMKNAFVTTFHLSAPAMYDCVFARDFAWVIGDNLIITKSKLKHRSLEAGWVYAAFEDRGCRPAMLAEGCWAEGADLIPTHPYEFALGHGRRTSFGASWWVQKEYFEGSKFSIHETSKEGPGIPQHLLGGNRVVGGTLYHRVDVEPLPGWRGKVQALEPNKEVVELLSMNWLVLSPTEILMPDDTPQTKAMMEKNGITVYTLPMSEFRSMGGGFACATLPLWRL